MLLSEVMGKTNDLGPHVYLSDGGHFESLGLYELVRRECRLIIVSDATEDPNWAFESLGNAVERCQTTARYDRRGEVTKPMAAQLLHVPYVTENQPLA